MASELNTKIQKIAEAFAQTVIGTLRGMTLDDIAGLVQHGGTAVVEPVKARRAARARRSVKPAGKPGLSAKQAGARRIQGQYLGYLRSFAGAERARIISLGKKSGIPAAVAEMLKLRQRKIAAKPAVAARKGRAITAPTPTKKTPARKLKISPARAAQLKVQGAYIGLMRSLPAAEKARVKAIAAKKGMAAAVAKMRKK